MQESIEGVANLGSADSSWRRIYVAGAAAALIAVVCFRRNLATELVTFGGFGIFDVPSVHPSNPLEWFVLFQQDTLLALTLYDLVNLVNYVLVGIIFLALYGALRRANKGAMAAATALCLVGTAVYVASNQAFAMKNLSVRYAEAASEAQRSALLAAGESLLAIHNPGSTAQGTGIHISLFLVLVAGLIVSVVMLRSGRQCAVFGRPVAYSGLVANCAGLTLYFTLVFAPAFNAIPHVIAGPFRLLWYVLIAVGLLRLARRTGEEEGRERGGAYGTQDRGT